MQFYFLHYRHTIEYDSSEKSEKSDTNFKFKFTVNVSI